MEHVKKKLFAITGLVFYVVHYITLEGFVGLVSWARGQKKMSITDSKLESSKL
jgi:hypothetical protein